MKTTGKWDRRVPHLRTMIVTRKTATRVTIVTGKAETHQRAIGRMAFYSSDAE